MSLFENIQIELDNGRLDAVFSARDLRTADRRVNIESEEKPRYRVGCDFYAETYINTELANFAVDGYYVRKGLEPRYRRVGVGMYSLLGQIEQDEVLDADEGPIEMNLGAALYKGLEAEARFARYLETHPFTLFDRKRRRVHPATPAVGFAQRLASYFWPNPETGFAATKVLIDGFVARANVSADNMSNDQLVGLFREICRWGGVALPTDDPATVRHNLSIAAKASREEPAAMNSAWTKLYAMFYPDEFVIFDSRVATALIGIAETVMAADELQRFKAKHPSLGKVVGRGGTRPRATITVWKNAYRSWPAQLDANVLVKRILSALNARGSGRYTLRDLEAVLFMEGY